ncbi:MAG: LamG-like jellyroll fold domain-containing protein, partial [Cyclobacteriaceae bacterium]
MGNSLSSLRNATLLERLMAIGIFVCKTVIVASFISNYAFANSSGTYSFFGTEAIVTVTNTNSSGAGSLSQTIFDASAGDTVTFDPSLDNGTISGLGISINKDITIDASDLPNGITLVGFGGGPVFNVSSGTVTFRGLTLTNPSIDDNFTIGGIANFGITTIENCHFTNIGTGDGPTLTAGVYNEDGASMTLINTSFSNITGASGIRNEGSLVMLNVTLNDVDTDQGGGGLDVLLNTATGVVSANHITIFNNAGVAIRNLAPREDFSINFSVVDESYDLGGEATVYGNGIEGNQNVFGDSPVDITGTGNFFANPGNTDLFISAIADNGGPVPTCAIASNSPALNFASNSTVARDAQGFYLNGTRDAGAFEFNAITSFTPFITTWITSDGEITIPTIGGDYAYDITWSNITGVGGDGSDTNLGSGDYTITGLNNDDTYQVEISGNFPRIYFNDGSNSPVPGSNSSKIRTIEQWGDIAWESMGSAFQGCRELTYNASDSPDLSSVTDMSFMFNKATSFDGDLSGWDVSTITTMQSMFDEATTFNQDINGWEVTLVENFNRMFAAADNFNQPLDSWDVVGATDMSGMFAFTDESFSFNQPLDGWGTKLNGLITVQGMFQQADAFNQDLNSWDVSTVQNFDRMFTSTDLFDGNISGWTLTAADGMSQMFSGAEAFNSDITGWGVGNVTNMSGMFSNAAVFDQDIGGWNVSSVTDMGGPDSDPFQDGMFEGAVAFDQDLSGWDISAVTDMESMFDGSGMSQENYDATLAGWLDDNSSTETIPTGITLGADGINYCDPTARDALTSTPHNWTINDAGQQCPPPIAYYPFNGNANDESGNGNDGTESGGVALSTDRFGTADAAYNFDGIDGLISVSTSTSLESPITDITISAWVNIESFPTNNQAPVLTKGTVNEQYGLMLSSDGFWILAGIGGSNLGTPSLDQWTMATITYSANTISFYENGVFLGSLPGQINPPVVSEPLEIGANKPGDVEYFDGSIDDIRIYDRALPQSEIVELYAESNWLQVSPDAFVTTWETTSPGETIILPLTDGSGFGQNYTYDFIIDWGDGTVEHNTSTDLSHTYATPGTHRVAITGTFPFMSFNASGKNGSIDKLMSIEQWGDIEWESLSIAFYNCTNLVVNATDVPDLTNLTTTSMTFTFGNTAIVDGVGNWDVSTVTSFDFMFYQSTNFNEDLGGWDISNITDMSDMLVDVGMSIENYDATLTGWATLDAGESGVPSGVTLTATGLSYCASETERQSLIDSPNNWTITGDIKNCIPSISSFGPASGPVGASVTITGTNFDPTPTNNIVYFGGMKAEVTAASETELTVTVPTGAMYDYISVLTSDLIAYSPLKFTPAMPLSNTLDVNSFSPAVNITGVNGPRNLLLADIDLDGKLDMAAISQGDAEVALFRNISSSGNIDATSFESGITYFSGSNAVWLSAADLDRDGRLDLVSNHASGGSIGIYKNNASTGSFNAATLDARADISLNALSEELSIGDLNRDGQLDIVTTSNNNTLFQLFNNTTTIGALTTGSFDAPLDFTAGDDAISIAVGDLDGDGLVDVVTGNRGDVNITTMLNTTSGSYSFESPETRSAGNNPWGLELADIDGDGRLDVVASSQLDNQLYLYRNTSAIGIINLENPVSFALPSGSFQLAIGDLSGDGKPEIVVASTGGGISVFQNQATSGTINSSSLATRIDYPSNNGELLAIGDLDGDGANDIAVAAAGGTISLLRNTLLDGPLAQYDFTAGSTADLSGYGFDATANGVPTQTQDRFLNSNQAYNFDGNDDNMLASGFDVEPATITAVNWFKFPEGGAGGTRQMIDIEGVGALALVDQQLIGVLRINGGFSTPLYPVTLSPDLWYMAALTFDGNDLDLYLNGELVASNADAGTIDLTGGTNNVIIGTNFDGTQNFNGELDDLKIYGRALDATEILELYNTDGWDVTNINEFSFAEENSEAVIDTAANTVEILVNFGTDPSSLTPTFSLSPQATARIASIVQTSGATANDYTNAVTYEITSSDGLTVENWTVTVSVDNGLIVDMPFNGDASDISGKGNNGTLQGPTSTTDRFANATSAYTFDGNDQINVPNNATLQLTDHITLSAWVTLNETADDQSIIHKGEDGFIDYLLNVFGTGRPTPGVVEFGSQTFPQFVEGVTRVDDGEQHHILGTYDGATLSVYVDGVLDNSQAASGNLFVGDGSLNIGAFATLPSTMRFANGTIDDVKVFSRTLDATEVRELYNEQGWDVTNINEFSFSEQVQEADIDTATNTVNIFVSFGTDPSNLTPTFHLSTGATARIASAVQTSGATANDYTNPVIYEITSEDGLTMENWTITAAVDNGIVVDLPFAGNALDQSGKGNHGTINGAAALTVDRFSVADNAYLFDGVDDFIDVSGASSTEFSASFWFKANSITTENNSPDLQSIYYLYNTDGGTTAHSTTRLKASKIDVVQLRQESPNAFESYSESFNDNVRWHHMVVTGSATQATTIYVDNQLQYTGEMGFTGWTDLVLGYSRFSGGTDFFDGAIDDVKVFSYVIDADQVDDLYRENGWPLFSDETDIVSFSVPGQSGDALIDTDAHTVDIEVQFGTDPTNLLATFELSDGATATVNAIAQTSAVSVNDFTNPLVYQVLAEDEFTSQSWLVTVTVLPDMIAYYPFNGNANDASGNGNNATQNGGVSPTQDRFGNVDRAFDFDGVDDNIFVSSVELKDAFATSIWFKTDVDFNSTYALMMDVQGYFGFVAVDNSTSRILIRNEAASTSYEVINGTSTIVDNSWHHGVASFDGTSLELYIDGVKENEALTDDFKEFANFDILMGSGDGGAYWNGSLDDIRIYGRALTPQEITDLYEEGGWPLTPDGTESILARQGAGGIEADGVTYETLTVQVKDAEGRDISRAGIAVEFSASEGTTDDDTDLFTDPNSIVTAASGSMTVVTDATGLATVRLANSEIEQLSVTAQIDTDDDDVVDAPVSGGTSPLLINYIIGEPSVTSTGSVTSSSGPSTVADGSSTITVSAQLKDASGRDIAQSGVEIQFVTTGSASLSGTPGTTTVTTNGLGQASVEVTNAVIETITVRAFVDVNSINGFEDPDEQISVGGNSNGIVQIDFTADPTSALLSDVAIVQVNKADGLDIELQSDETGTIYWIINLTGVFPEAAAIKSASAATNGSGSFSISSADVLVQQTIAGTSLTDATRYQLYLVHEDENGNFSAVENLSWTADSAAPEISNATIDPATPTTVSLVFTEELVFDVVAGITLTDDDGAVV